MAMNYQDVFPVLSLELAQHIPASMKSEKRWVCWGGNKAPVSVRQNQAGKHFGINVIEPDSWGTFDEAFSALGDECYLKRSDESFHVAGVGFVVGDGWFCADLDGGKAHQGKEDVPESVVQDVIEKTGTYAERSLSSCGYHVFGKCDFIIGKDEPENNKPHRDSNSDPLPDSYEIEFFTRRKFIAITGNVVPGAGPDAIACDAGARDVYQRYIHNDWLRDEEKRESARAKSSKAIHGDAATEFFLLNYPEILAYSDSSNFKRDTKGESGVYSWIGAVKSLQGIGVPESAIMDWCRRGSNFKNEKDVLRVLNEPQKVGAKSCLGSVIQDAQNHGWKADQDKLTGKYREKHERAEENSEMLQTVTAELERFRTEKEYVRQLVDVFGEDRVKIKDGLSADNRLPVETKPKTEKKKSSISVVDYSDVVVSETDYMFFPWFPRGKVTTIQGDSGTSKSTFLYAIGARVTTGSDLVGVPCEDPGRVMFLTNEDDESDILTAFLDAGGDMTKLLRIKEREMIAQLNLSSDGAEQLNQIVKEEKLRFLCLDPIQAFLGGDMNKANETRPQMVRLMNIAAENNICIAFIQHTGKDTSKSALHRGIGSVDIVAATRSVIQIVTDPEDDNYKIAYTVKNNTAALHDVRKAIRYQVKDHPGSYDSENRHHHFHGHAEFVELIPNYSEQKYKQALKKSEGQEAALKLGIDYESDPLVITVRELIAQNPDGLFIGSDDLIAKITECCGHCPYGQTKDKTSGLNNRLAFIRDSLIDKDGIQVDMPLNPLKAKPYHWRGEIFQPELSKVRGVKFTPVISRNANGGLQITI